MNRRTTVAANADDLVILEYEAKRRGVSLSHVLREAVTQYAANLRTTRRPRFGIGHGGPGLSQASADDEAAPIEVTKTKTKLRPLSRAKPVTQDDPIFALIGIGDSGIPGGISTKKHEYLVKAKRQHQA